VIVDIFSKMAYFIPRSIDASFMAKMFFKEIVRLRGIPTSIVFDRDVRFVSYLWKILSKLFGTTFKYSSAFYPQIDGQLKLLTVI